MAESTTPKTKKLTRDNLPSDSSSTREDTEQLVSAHQDKHDYMWCLLNVQKNQQSMSQKDSLIGIKEEFSDLDSEFPEQFDFHGQLELFNRDQSVSGQEIIMTDVQGENEENLSALSGSECTQNIKNGFFKSKMYVIKVKGEFMENDEEPHNYFDANNIEKSFSPQKSILKNVKNEIIENEVTFTGDLKVQNSEKCIDEKSNTISVKEEVETYSPDQLGIYNYNQCFSDRKITITDVKGGVTDNETDFLGLVKITNIKTCDSAQIFNNTFVKKEEPEDDLEFPKHFETPYREQEKTVSKQKSNTVIVKDEQIEIESELHEDYNHLLRQVPAKGITDEKTPKEHICNVSCGSFCSKEKLTRNMQINTHPVKQFKCEICEKVFYRSFRFSTHMNVHTKKKEYKCKFCEKVYYRQNSLYHHLKNHTKEIKYKCQFCDRSFSDTERLSAHLNAHTTEKNYKCEICDKVYFLKSSFYAHKQSHLNEEQRSCKFCGKLFSTPHSLKLHLNIHTKEKEFKCEECGKVFYMKDSLNHHKIYRTKKKNV